MKKLPVWHPIYRDCPPVGHLLRNYNSDLWLRVHTLPKGKRYATNTEEENEINFRYQSVAEQLLDASDAELFVSFYSGDLMQDPSSHNSLRDLNLSFFGGVKVDEEQFLNTYHSKFKWSLDLFCGLMRDVAEEKISFLSFLSAERGNVFSPYDGGIDLFFSTLEEKKRSEILFKAWLSSRDDGL